MDWVKKALKTLGGNLHVDLEDWDDRPVADRMTHAVSSGVKAAAEKKKWL